MSDGTIDLGGGSSGAFQFKNAGDRVRGTIIDFKQQQQTHFDGPQKGEPRCFPDGKPMMMIVVELQTAYRNSEGLKDALPAGSDEGKRVVFLKSNKAPDTTSTMAAVITATTRAVGKGQLKIGAELELILVGEVKSHTGQLAKQYSANYWPASVDLGGQAAAAAVPAPPVAVPTPPTPPAAPAAVPAPPAAGASATPASGAATDPILANLTPAQLAILAGGQAAAVPPPPPAAVPAPPVAVPPPPPAVVAPRTTPEGFTLEQLVSGGWTREAALATYPMLAG